MRYSLAIYKKDKNKDITGYTKIPGFDHLSEEKIKDIVEFTNEFENEYDLKNFLLEENLITSDMANGILGINFYQSKDSKPKLLDYGISFKEDKKFFDTIFLQYYFSSKIKNFEFLEAFIKKYYTYLKDVSIFSEELNFINYGYKCMIEQKELPVEIEKSVKNFVTLYCRKKGKDGNYKADFTKIRDLAMFAINYERNYNREPIEYPKFPKAQLNDLIEHYRTLLQEGATDEQRRVYVKYIKELKQQLALANEITLSRRKNNGTTEN